MDAFTKFATTRGVLSTLFVLGVRDGMSRTQLSNVLSVHDIGSSSQKTSLRVLHELGLVTTREVKQGGVRMKLTWLTPKGKKASKLARELFTLLTMKFETQSQSPTGSHSSPSFS